MQALLYCGPLSEPRLLLYLERRVQLRAAGDVGHHGGQSAVCSRANLCGRSSGVARVCPGGGVVSRLAGVAWLPRPHVAGEGGGRVGRQDVPRRYFVRIGEQTFSGSVLLAAVVFSNVKPLAYNSLVTASSSSLQV